MNMAKKIWLGILCTISVLIVPPTNASLVGTNTYGSSRSHSLKTFNNVPRREQLDFVKIDKKRMSDNNEENGIKRQKIEEEDKENAGRFAAIQARVTCADGDIPEEMIVTLESEKRERKQIQWEQHKKEREKDDEIFFKNLELTKQEQIRLSRKTAIEESRKKVKERGNRKDQRQQQKEANPTNIKPARSEYGKNIQKFATRSDGTPTGPLNEFAFYVAEENFEHAILTAQFNLEGFSFFAPTAALLQIGDKRPSIPQDPKKLYDMLHSEPMAKDLSVAQVNKCARYFARKAGNNNYLEFTKSLNQ